MKRKILAILLAAALAVSLLPGTAWAEDAPTSGTCGENVTWTYGDGLLTIEGTGPMDDYSWGDNYDLAIPWSDYQINAIKIGNGVTSIGDYAFFGCDSLTDVAIPDSVTTIGYETFSNCYSLASVAIPDGVTIIEFGAFFSCYSLTSVTIPNSITSLGMWAFALCYNLKDVYYGGSESQWEQFDINPLDDYNEPLLNATIHYNSTGPKDEPKITFSDVSDGDWFADTVREAVQRGLIAGDGEGRFNPTALLTRASTLVILGRLSGADVDNSDPWYQKALDWAMTEGISDGTNPNGSITREQLAVMLWRFEDEPEADASVLSGHIGSSDISDWAVAAMAWAVSTGIIRGGDSGLNPTGTASRAEAVTMIMRYCDMFGK